MASGTHEAPPGANNPKSDPDAGLGSAGESKLRAAKLLLRASRAEFTSDADKWVQRAKEVARTLLDLAKSKSGQKAMAEMIYGERVGKGDASTRDQDHLTSPPQEAVEEDLSLTPDRQSDQDAGVAFRDPKTGNIIDADRNEEINALAEAEAIAAKYENEETGEGTPEPDYTPGVSDKNPE